MLMMAFAQAITHTSLDPSVKVRRGGVGSHLCIHKYFYERSPMWQQVRDEESKASENPKELLQEEAKHPADADHSESIISSSLKFEPMDARHLSSLPLLRARVERLLKACKNEMHESNNIMLKLVGPLPDILAYTNANDRASRTQRKRIDGSSKHACGNSPSRVSSNKC